MDTLFWSLTINLCHQLKYVKEVGILPDPPPPPVGPEGQIWVHFLNEPSLNGFIYFKYTCTRRYGGLHPYF